MSDVICDCCKQGCEPAFEAVDHKCGHLVHLCSECFRDTARRVAAASDGTPDIGAIHEAALVQVRVQHVCGDTGGPVSEAEVPPPEPPIVGSNLAEVVLEGCVRLWGADVGKRVATAAIEAVCEASVRERQQDLVDKLVEQPAALALVTMPPRHQSSSRIASVFDGVDRSALPATIAENLTNWGRPHGAPEVKAAPEVEGACPEMPRFHVGVDLAAIPPSAVEADGDVTQYPPLPASTRSSAPGMLRIVGRDPEDPGVVHVGVAPARTAAEEREGVRARSAEFLRDLLAHVEAGDYLHFVGVAWGGKLGPGTFYSDLPSTAEALGHLELARVAITDEFFSGE